MLLWETTRTENPAFAKETISLMGSGDAPQNANFGCY